jgi:hypothetical protein
MADATDTADPALDICGDSPGNLEMAVSLVFCTSSTPAGNDFQPLRGNQRFGHFQMSTISTSTGDSLR